MRDRAAIRYTIDGDLRFISHSDSLRLFERCLARAGVPVRFSGGFNPRPRISLPLPRPVGVASRDERLVVELTRPVEPTDLMKLLAPHVPDGMTVQSAELLPDGHRMLPAEASYELPLHDADRPTVARRIEQLLAATTLPIERSTPGRRGERHVDLRPFIEAMAVDGPTLRWTQKVTAAGSARIGEVLAQLGLAPQEHLHHVVRTGVVYQP